MHANLDGFERAKSNISDEFGRGTGTQIHQSLVLLEVLFTDQVRIELLEELITTVLEATLNTVSPECWAPASEDASEPLSATNLAPCLDVAPCIDREYQGVEGAAAAEKPALSAHKLAVTKSFLDHLQQRKPG